MSWRNNQDICRKTDQICVDCHRGGFLLYHDHKNDKSVAYDFRETAPAAATPGMLTGVAGVVRLLMLLADLSTRPYLPVLVRKSAGSTDVRSYFSKYRHRVSRKYRNRDVNECEFVANEADHRPLMELSFVVICIFQVISGTEVYGRSWLVKKVF